MKVVFPFLNLVFSLDCMKMGKDVFVNNTYTTNRKGYEWLKKQLKPKGYRTHFIDFPGDLFPMHLDTNFVPLRPYFMFVNPERPPRKWLQMLCELVTLTKKIKIN